MYRIAVLISGRGSNLEAILQAVKSGYIGNAEVVVVLSNREDARGLRIAKGYGVEALYVPAYALSKEEYDSKMLSLLEERDVDLVVLAGFMRILSDAFVDHFKDRIVNIHPSLLPSFKGLHAQRQALEAGVRFSGATVHFVTEKLDEGPIIVQSVVPVLEGDSEESLSERILKTEHIIYPLAIKLICEGRVKIEDNRCRVDWKGLSEEFHAINPVP